MWIPVDAALPRHPKALRLAGLLKDERAWARVVQLWLWAAEYAPDGRLGRFTDAEIIMALGYGLGDGAAPKEPRKILRSAGFLDKDSRIHDWNSWTGKHLRAKEKKRLWMEQKRKSESTLKPRGSDVEPTSGSDVVATRKPRAGRQDRTGQDTQDRTGSTPPPAPAPRRGTRCLDCQAVLEELNRLKGSNYQASGKSGAGLHARHGEHGVEVCLEVVRHRHATAITDTDRFYFRPSTLFRPDNFENELEAMRTGAGPPREQSTQRREHLAESAVGKTSNESWEEGP